MNRQQKETVVSDLKGMFVQSQASFLVRYKGLSVKDVSLLRKDLREKGGHLKVTKARLMKIASDGLEGVDTFKATFRDQVGLVFALEDVPTIAKKLVMFSKDHEKLEIVSGYFESKSLTKPEIEFLASLPSREVLVAQLLGTMQAPVTNFTRALQMIILQLLYTLQQIADKKE